MDDALVRMLILDLLKNPSERDKQSKIGASEIGNPCDYCVGYRLLNMPKLGNRYWMGAKIGTAIHTELENEEAKHIVEPQNYRFAELKDALIEHKISLGVIEGYGEIRSKPDLVLVNAKRLIDHKTSSKAKIDKYKIQGVPKQYIYQQQLYAWGLNKAGIPIERISLSFVNRAGLTDDDVWVYSFDYDEQLALAAWNRLQGIWNYLQENDIETLRSHPECYDCSQIRGRI